MIERDAQEQTTRGSLGPVGANFSYQSTLRAAFTALLLLILLSGSLSYYSIEQSRYYHQRSQFADDVLEAYLDLSALLNKCFKEASHAALVGPEGLTEETWNREAHFEDNIAHIRRLIAQEVQLVGKDEDEGAEFVELDLLEKEIEDVHGQLNSVQALIDAGDRDRAQSRLAEIFEQGNDVRLQRRIDDAIAEETADAARADDAGTAVIRELEIYSAVAAVLVLVLAAGTFFALIRRLGLSFLTLSKGVDAVAEGDLNHRIPPIGDRDFDSLGRHFNRMAKDLKSDREKLLEAQDLLEDTIAERTAELDRAKERLEGTDRARRRFLADVGHELRTPLTVIRGEGEIALRGKDKEVSAYKASLKRIVEQTGHTATLLDDLLFMVRTGQGEVRLATRHVPLSKILEDAVSAFEVIAAERNMTIVLELNAEDATVSGDRVRLRQTFIALIDNAIRYSEAEGEIRINLTEDSGTLLVTVEDDGIGIPEEDLALVFERFYRGDNAIRQAQGTGLGLPLAKAIVEAHGGNITIESAPGEGITAAVTLPSAKQFAPAG